MPQTPPTAGPVRGDFQPVTVRPGQVAPKEPEQLFTSQTFLRLLSSQIRSQNPLEPLKDTEFLAQMAQFSSLEQMTNLATTMKSLNLTTQLTQGAALIGREVTYMPEGGEVPVTGRVERMIVENGGRDSALVINGIRVSPSQMREVR